MSEGKSDTGTARVSGTTRVVGILGEPINHTLSPRMHNAAFAELGLDYVYVPFRATKQTLREAIKSIRTMGVVGFNVTVPFKEDCLRLLERTSDTARAIGAVNTIYLSDGRLVGENTDAPGFHQALLAHGFRPRGKRVLVIGAGGSARAVVHSLVATGAADIVIANRTAAKARKLARQLGGEAANIRTADLEILDDFDFLATRQLVVNSTSVGLGGGAFLDYDADSTPDDCVHFDLAYAEGPTPFLKLAEKAERPTIDGRHMLVHQGALAFKLFTGRKAPVEVMAKAIGIASR